MRLFTHTILINRPREEVFDFFLDVDQAPRWRSFVTSMRPIDSGPIREGTRFDVRLELMGEEHQFELVALKCDRPSLWRHSTNEKDYNGFVEYRFDVADGGTLVSMSMNVKPRSVTGWLSLPLLWMRRGQPYKDQLPRLKAAIESLDGA